MEEKLTACPYCGELWSLPEIEDQECYECGYPNPVLDPGNATNMEDNDHLYVDSMGGLTPFSDGKIDINKVWDALPERILENYYRF